MTQIDELQRVYRFRNGEIPSALYETIVFECDDRNECITKLLSVMELIAEQQPDHWPDDDYWRKALPGWLTGTFRTYTSQELAEIRSDRSRWPDLAWTFGSWIDRMRDRDWEWWSIGVGIDNSITVRLVIDGHPFSAKALKHLISAAGGRLRDLDQ